MKRRSKAIEVTNGLITLTELHNTGPEAVWFTIFVNDRTQSIWLSPDELFELNKLLAEYINADHTPEH